MPEVYVQIVGAGTAGIPPSVMLVAGRHRFLFDCGEQSQRFITEHKLRTQNLDALFFTQIDWHHLGGLSDLLMTVADNGRTEIALYGPAPLYCYVLSMQMFLYRPSFTLDVHQIQTQPGGKIAFSIGEKDDGEIHIRPILLSPIASDQTAVPEEHNGESGVEECCLRKRIALAFDVGRRVCNMRPELRPTVSRQGHLPPVMCFAIETPEVRGKFDMHKARALGVPPGPLCGKLTKGESITTPDGRTVHPSDCLGASVPGPIFLLVRCPSADYVPLLLTNELIKAYTSNREMACVIHVTPKDVLQLPEYKAWMESFISTKVTHILVGETVALNVDRTLFKASNAHSIKLNYALPSVFPLPFDIHNFPSRDMPSADEVKEPSLKAHEKAKSKGAKGKQALTSTSARPEPIKEAEARAISALLGQSDIASSGRIVLGDNLLKFCLMPQSRFGLDWTHTDELGDEAPYYQVLQALQADPKLNAALREALPDRLCAETSADSAQVVFLGTVASASNPVRSESCIYLDIPNYGGILLDAGGGAYQQMVRRYGQARAHELLAKLRCIWITHKHADHCAGVVNIVRIVNKLKRAVQDNHSELKPTARRCKCSVCDFVFSNRKSLFMHEPIHHLASVAGSSEEGQLYEDASKNTAEERDDEVDFSPPLSSASVLVVGPFWLEPWLVDYDETIEPIEYQFLDALYLTKEWRCGSDQVQKERLPLLARYFREALGLKSIYSFIVEHSYPTFAVTMEHESGWKLVYSGDTRPCPQMIEVARGADVLIHEATFDEDMQEKAVSDRHSTVREALRVALEAKPACVILTHFSGRFERTLPDVPSALQAIAKKDGGSDYPPIILAQDFMSIPVGGGNFDLLRDVAAVMKPLHDLFASESQAAP